MLIHVADGWAARNIHQLDLRESEEIQGDRAYLEGVAAGLERDGLRDGRDAGERRPGARDRRRGASASTCDLIAMSTHGHRFF